MSKLQAKTKQINKTTLQIIILWSRLVRLTTELNPQPLVREKPINILRRIELGVSVRLLMRFVVATMADRTAPIVKLTLTLYCGITGIIQILAPG